VLQGGAMVACDLAEEKSCAWIAVVPSYSESILASRMYCSTG